jgi:leucyl aminopeptidase
MMQSCLRENIRCFIFKKQTMNPLRIETTTAIPSLNKNEAIAVCIFEDEPRIAGNANAFAETINNIITSGEFKGEEETSFLVHTKDAKLLLIGCGKHKEFDLRTVNHTAGSAVREARDANVKRLFFTLPENHHAQVATEGAIMGLYENSFYQKKDEEEKQLETFALVVDEETDAIKKAIERGRIIAESANWVRELADLPGLSLPPREFAKRAAEMANEFNLKVETLDADEIQKRGMGGLWGIGKGSDEPPVMIVVRYEPADANDDELIAFVGKGITFDTGGISIKPREKMEEMKSDMTGGATVLGALRAIAQLKPNKRVVAIVPSAENMPSGKSIKPGDVVKTLAGYNLEVVDTDAEGRVVLADGIAYAKELGAKKIVDLATLTGSIIIALGNHRTGLFSNNDDWADEIIAASERAGESVWRMPISDDYKKKIESDIADFKNYGGKPDATGAALLLSKFAGDTPWVHLDIAGTAWYDDATSFAPKGASGVCVKTLVELICD